MSPKVSIVMSSWNRAALLAKGLNSIFTQGYPNLEVIVVDDGSKDDTKEVCERYPVKYIYHDKPKWGGQGPAQNIGIRAATNDIIILQNPEVVHLQSDTIHRLASAIEDDDKLWVMAHVERQEAKDSPRSWTACGTAVPRRCAFFLCALWRKWLVEIGGFDEDYTHAWTEDDDLADRLIDYVGLKQVFTDDIKGLHLWHPDYVSEFQLISNDMYLKKSADMKAGRISHIRNGGPLCTT
jgi:glycosyltransferase involved in cell wall biosynthesis